MLVMRSRNKYAWLQMPTTFAQGVVESSAAQDNRPDSPYISATPPQSDVFQSPPALIVQHDKSQGQWYFSSTSANAALSARIAHVCQQLQVTPAQDHATTTELLLQLHQLRLP